MQYSCGKININIPDGYGDIKDIVFSAHIIVRYNNGHCGGIDPHIIGLCKQQIRRMSLYPILIIVSRDSKVIDDYKNLDIAYVDCTQCSNNFETALHVKNILKLLKIQLIHCHGYSTNYFLYMLKKLDKNGFGKVKTVITCHGWVEYNLKKKFLTYFDFWTYSMGDAFICVSETMKKRLESIIKNKKIVAINNGINVSNSDLDVVGVQDFKKEFCIPNNKKIICYVGRLDPEKRPDRFLEFAEKLFLVREDVIFIMAGNGSMWAALKEKICHLKCRDNFRLLGEIYPATIVYQISDLLYIPYDTEGIPMCVLESMSQGTPVLASNVGGLSEIIEHRVDGFLFEKEDVEGVCACANFLLNDSEYLKYIGENSKSKIRKHFSVQKMFVETMRVYDELLEKSSHG
ncbi:glycosyl transferase, group 1 family protein [Streptococcus pneumoniae]|nr:glycosyl transferase, group 1 family protein [Streptococcus pneumoniae]